MFKVTTYYTLDENAIQQYNAAWMKIWTENAWYTRNAIISLLGSLGDTQEVSKRLLKTQENIGDLMRTYYDSAMVDELTGLLKLHVSIAVDTITAAKAGDPTVDLIATRKNALSQIVEQLEKMNPDWEQTNLESLWNNYLNDTVDEIQFRIDKNWSSDVLNFDRLMTNVYLLANCMSQGVVNQNKIKFCNQSNGGPYEHTE